MAAAQAGPSTERNTDLGRYPYLACLNPAQLRGERWIIDRSWLEVNARLIRHSGDSGPVFTSADTRRSRLGQDPCPDFPRRLPRPASCSSSPPDHRRHLYE